MITTSSLLYDLDLRLNKVATSKHQSIAKEDKIVALNDALIRLVKDKIGPDRTFGLGLDGFKKKYEDLENLIQPHTPFAVTKDKVGKLNKYLLDLKAVTPKYMFYVDVYFLCDKGNCKNRVVTVQDRVKHADIHRYLANTNTSPSFEYQESLITTTDNFIEFYTDGTFIPTKGYLSYLRYPKKIDVAGYVNEDGTPSINSDTDLKEYLADELLNYAVIELGFETGNMNAVQAAQTTNQNNE